MQTAVTIFPSCFHSQREYFSVPMILLGCQKSFFSNTNEKILSICRKKIQVTTRVQERPMRLLAT